MRYRTLSKQLQAGFTLIEVMVVIVLIGLMASVIQFSFSGNQPEKLLEKESERFSAIFNMAAEYSMLNNLELGLLIEENSYQFLGFDGEKWVAELDNELLETYTLPEEMELSLALDDLPLEEAPLINYLKENEEIDLTFSGSELDEEKKLIPQVYILSGGDLTPFSLRFAFADTYNDVTDVSYKVTGLYTTPLTIEGPIFNE